jgi:mono/diheme cytochrome c family protein
MERHHRPRHRAVFHLATAVTLGWGLLAGQALAADAPSSTCVACHTDAGKLKAESAGIPQPKGSALQAGKG